MRYIDLSQIILPEEWLDFTNGLLDELRAADSNSRPNLLKKDKFCCWRMLIPLLRNLSHNKCFYSERKLNHGVPEVDHFRPKGGVAKSDLNAGETHTGYWWLAVKYANFRLSCSECNRLDKDPINGVVSGKGTRFPVAGKRAQTEGDSELDERALLLDPTCLEDTKLIVFDDMGLVKPANTNPDSEEYKRADVSILCYHLDEDGVQTRRGECCTTAKHLVQSLEDLLAAPIPGNLDLRRIIEIKIALREMVQDYSEYSIAVRNVVRAYIYLPFVKALLEEVE